MSKDPKIQRTRLHLNAFRREYRMQVAAKMLRDMSLAIAEIAGMVGYENPGKFSAAFREIMGLTPGEYRKK